MLTVIIDKLKELRATDHVIGSTVTTIYSIEQLKLQDRRSETGENIV